MYSRYIGSHGNCTVWVPELHIKKFEHRFESTLRTQQKAQIMVVLTTAQERKIQAISVAKAEFDKWDAEAKIAFGQARDAAKNPIRALIAVALEEDHIPMRQIHFTGMGYQQAKSLVAFLTPFTGQSSVERALGVALPPTVEGAYAPKPLVITPPNRVAVVVNQRNNQAEWTDHDGVYHKIERRIASNTPTIYYCAQGTVNRLTEGERFVLENEVGNTLLGDDEYETWSDSNLTIVPDRFTV